MKTDKQVIEKSEKKIEISTKPTWVLDIGIISDDSESLLLDSIAIKRETLEECIQLIKLFSSNGIIGDNEVFRFKLECWK